MANATTPPNLLGIERKIDYLIIKLKMKNNKEIKQINFIHELLI